MKNSIRLILLLLMVIAGTTWVPAQTSSLDPIQPFHQVKVIGSLQDFLDGSSVINRQRFHDPKWFSPALGLAYNHTFKSRNELEISARYMGTYFDNGQPNLDSMPVLWTREAIFVEASLSHPIVVQSGMSLALLAGVQARLGYEQYLLGSFAGEAFIDTQPMLDPGVLGGLRFSNNISQRFQFSTELKYTQYLYRHFRTGSKYVALVQGPPKQMVSLQLSIGYRFGKNK